MESGCVRENLLFSRNSKSPSDTYPHVAADSGSALEAAQDVVLQVVELAFFFQTQVARAIKWHLDVFHDGPRMRAHNKDPVGQVNCLFHVVRDKQNCTRSLIPDLQQKLLHFTAGLSVESAKRLVHQDH